MSNTKARALEIYQEHIELAATDGRLFRKTVMEQIMLECGVSVPSAATHYNEAKKALPIDGLGRLTVVKGARKVSAGKNKIPALVPDEECFAVLELVGENQTVGRTQSFILQGDASEEFDSKVQCWPHSTWVMVQGLGPNHGDTFVLEPEEKEIKRYSPEKVTI